MDTDACAQMHVLRCMCSASEATVLPDFGQTEAAAGRISGADKASLTCVNAGRKVTHCTIAVILQGVLIIGLPCLFFLLESPYQV